MKDYPFKDRTKKDIKPGGSARLRTKDGKPQNIVGAAGLYSVTHYVYAKGKPGDYLEVLLSLVDTRPSPDVSSDAHTQKFEFGSDGILKIAVESKITVKGGFAVHAKVRAPGTNVGNVTVTLQDSISYMFLG